MTLFRGLTRQVSWIQTRSSKGAMHHRILFTLLLGMLDLACAGARAEAPCPYCGEWAPFASAYQAAHVASDQLTLTESTIKLPGCAPTPVNRVLEFVPTDESRLMGSVSHPKLILRAEAAACAKPLSNLAAGTLVEVELRGGDAEKSEQLVLTLFPPNAFEALTRSYTYQRFPNSPITTYPRPEPLAKWWFVHEGFFSDEDAGDRAIWFAYAVEQYKAGEDLVLQEMSQRNHVPDADVIEALINCNQSQSTMNICSLQDSFSAQQKMRSSLSALIARSPAECRPVLEKTQTKWEKATERKCGRAADKQVGKFGTARAMVSNSCKTDAMKDRAQALQALGECSPCEKCLAAP